MEKNSSVSISKSDAAAKQTGYQRLAPDSRDTINEAIDAAIQLSSNEETGSNIDSTIEEVNIFLMSTDNT
jgi:hypothetical protein